MPVKTKNPLKEFNLNSILVIIATGVVGWLTKSGLDSVVETKKAVQNIEVSAAKTETALPFIKDSVTNLQGDLNAKHAGLVQSIEGVKADLKTGQAQLWTAIKDVRDQQIKDNDQK